MRVLRCSGPCRRMRQMRLRSGARSTSTISSGSQDVGSPELSPDGEWVALHGDDHRRRRGQAEHRRLEGQVGRIGTEPADVLAGERDVAASGAPTGSTSRSCRRGPGPASGNQVWLLERSGGEARQLTQFKGGVTSYRVVARLPAPGRRTSRRWRRGRQPTRGGERGPTPRQRRSRSSSTATSSSATGRPISPATPGPASPSSTWRRARNELLTSDGNANGPFDESSPSWSPDGSRIAFVSNHDENWDRTRNNDIFVVDATPGSKSRQLTTFVGQDGGGWRRAGVESRRHADRLWAGQRAQVQLP